MGDIQAVNEIHRIMQDKDKAISSAQALADQWRNVADRQRGEIEELKRQLAHAAGIVKDLEGKMQPVNEYVAALEQQTQHLCLSASRPIGYTNEVVLVNRAALHALARLAHVEGTQEGCPRCGSPLDNVGRGISVVAGGIRICTPCLNPGEYEVARARSM